VRAETHRKLLHIRINGHFNEDGASWGLLLTAAAQVPDLGSVTIDFKDFEVCLYRPAADDANRVATCVNEDILMHKGALLNDLSCYARSWRDGGCIASKVGLWWI
jgi:hypothetical protein